MVYVIQVCWQLASRIRTFHPDPAHKLSAHIPLLCVQWNTPDDGQRNCPKHAEFYSKNNFEKLVHLVGFIIRTGWSKWQWGKLSFNPFNLPPQYNFNKAPYFFLRGGISQRQYITPNRRKIWVVCIWWAEQIGKLLIMQFPRTPCYFLSLKLKYFFLWPVLKLQTIFSHCVTDKTDTFAEE